jgi:hypothetical protein
MTKQLPLAILLGASIAAHAAPAAGAKSAIDCAWLGYQIGQRYPVTANTKAIPAGLFAYHEVRAEAPVKPADVNEVRVFLSTKTFTIVHIIGSSYFRSEKEARAFADRYDYLITQRYAGVPKLEPLFGEQLRLQTGLCQVTVRVNTPSKAGDSWSADLDLQPLYTTPYMDQISELLRREYDELVMRNETQRGSLKGL